MGDENRMGEAQEQAAAHDEAVAVQGQEAPQGQAAAQAQTTVRGQVGMPTPGAGEADAAGDHALVTPQDLAGYAFPHDVQVAPDGSRAFFELTRVDMAANRYRTDIWSVDAATNEPRQLTATGEEGHYQVCDDGTVLFVSKRRAATATAGGSAGAKAAFASACPDAPARPPVAAPARSTDLYRIDPTGGEAQLVATIPGRAVSDWQQLDEGRFVLRCREKADAASPVVEIEEVPFFENGGTYMAGTRWGLWLLDLAALGDDRVAGDEALRPLTHPDEEVDAWTLSADRARVVFAARRYAGLRPVTDKLWSLAIADGERILVDDAPCRRSMLAPFRGGVLYLATDMRAHGVNEDPHPWWAPLDGSSMPERIEESEPDLYYGCAVGGDSSFGGGIGAKAVGDAWFFLSTELDRTYLRRMDPDGTMVRLGPAGEPDGIPGAVLSCFDTADGRTFWCVIARADALPEVYRLDVGDAGEQPAGAPASDATGAGGSSDAPAPAPGSVAVLRITHVSDVLAGKTISLPEAFTFESNGDVLTGYVIKPAGYVPGTRHPGVLEIHGGPKAAYGAVFSQEMQSLAARGYFVFFTNPHGSAGHGVAFSDIRGRYGQEDFADLMGFTDEVLRRYPDVNPERLAVMGGSYGGFMTNWVIGHTDRFLCANSQRSIANYMTKCLDSDIGYWVNMPETTGWLPGDAEVLGGDACPAEVPGADAATTTVLPVVGAGEVPPAGESAACADGPAGDLPPQISLAFVGDNPRRIWEQSPLAFAGNVCTPTLFLHSDEDYRCPLNEGMQMFTALQLRGVPSRLAIFKGECHGLCRSGKPQNRVRRLEEILAWYRRWLDDGAGVASEVPSAGEAIAGAPATPEASAAAGKAPQAQGA